jgi:hypothetical protein
MHIARIYAVKNQQYITPANGAGGEVLFRGKVTYAAWIILVLAGAAMLLARVSAGDSGGGGVHDIAIGHHIIQMLFG